MSLRSEKKLSSEISLYNPIGTDHDGNEVSFSEILGSDPELVPNEVDQILSSEELHHAIKNCLTKRERIVIELRYGLGTAPCMPQRAIAEMLEISRSYVSRIEKSAVEKLKTYLCGCHLIKS